MMPLRYHFAGPTLFVILLVSGQISSNIIGDRDGESYSLKLSRSKKVVHQSSLIQKFTKSEGSNAEIGLSELIKKLESESGLEKLLLQHENYRALDADKLVRRENTAAKDSKRGKEEHEENLMKLLSQKKLVKSEDKTELVEEIKSELMIESLSKKGVKNIAKQTSVQQKSVKEINQKVNHNSQGSLAAKQETYDNHKEKEPELFEGDIILTPTVQHIVNADPLKENKNSRSLRSMIQDVTGLWNKRFIPYVIDKTVDDPTKLNLIQAILDIEAKSCLRFKPLEREEDYVLFQGSFSCYSHVGRIGGRQILGVGSDGSCKRGNLMHELLHAIGFWHEQSRLDRDSYIRVNYQNIRKGKEMNFEKYTRGEVDSLNKPYDYGSIMHYELYAFSKNGHKTMEPLRDPGFVKIGQRNGLSSGDVDKVKTLYACNANDTQGWSDWQYYKACDFKCRKVIYRFCLNISGCSNEPWYKTVNCSYSECPDMDGVWSSWENWSSCSRSCGKGGIRIRRRTCSNPPRQRNGKDCQGEELQSEECGATIPCVGSTVTIHSPIDPITKKYYRSIDWLETLEVPRGYKIKIDFQSIDIEKYDTECSADYLNIYDGASTRSKLIGSYCGNQIPDSIITSHNTALLHFSTDDSIERLGFKLVYRPIDMSDGQWSKWSRWTKCSASCGFGVRQRSRSCTSPPPSNGGKECAGSSLQNKRCFLSLCIQKANTKSVGSSCDTTFLTPTGIISSQNYPSNYPNNNDCSYTILVDPNSVVKLNWKHFDLEYEPNCPYDSLTIFDKNSNGTTITFPPLCGTALPSFQYSMSNQVIVSFLSDTSVTAKGFELHYSTVSPPCNSNPCQNGGTCEYNYTTGYTCHCIPNFSGINCETLTTASYCNRIFTSISGAIASKNYPSNYDNLLDCNMTIQLPSNYKINLTWQDFAIEDDYQCGFDSLTIYDVVGHSNQTKLGRFCERTPPPNAIASTENTLILQFHTDESETRKGFLANYVGVPVTSDPTLVPTASSAICGTNIHQTSGEIKSPGYPLKYSTFSFCVFKIFTSSNQRLKINWIDFELEPSNGCMYDFVSIYDDSHMSAARLLKACGKKFPPSILSSRSVLTFEFTTDGDTEMKGFHFRYETVSVDICNADYNSSAGIIMSPNYPGLYPLNIDCQYLIRAPANHVITLVWNFMEIQASTTSNCSKDWINVYDGETAQSLLLKSLCDTYIPSSITSTSNRLLIVFHSDNYNQGRGFNASYYTTDTIASAPINLLPYQQDCLNEHNRLRRIHGVPDLQWLTPLQISAEIWATQLIATGSMYPSDTVHGENLYHGDFANPSTANVTQMVGIWYSEVANYDFSSPSFISAAKHFTQLIWKSTTHIGCGRSIIGNNVYLVAHYSPRGNFVGQFGQNVLPATS